MRFGAVYVIERDYSDEVIIRDLSNMRQDGYDLVTLWPVANPWLTEDPNKWECGRTRFVLDVCQKLGLQAILQLFGQNQSQEALPDALLDPECETIIDSANGLSSNVFWANLNHPKVRALFDAYFKEVIGQLKGHPALYGWDVFNEAHFRSDDPWTHARYRVWLKEKYGDIATLNTAWYRRYASFEQIRPQNRNAGYSVWSSLLPSYDYELFRSENLTEICRFLTCLAKQYDPRHPVIIDGTSGQILYQDVRERNNDEFATAQVPDIYGSTFYPKSWGRNLTDSPWSLSAYFAIPACAARAAGKPYAVDELQTHTQAALTPGSEVTPLELQSWIWMNLFQAPECFQLWRWRPFLHGYQVTGRGLTRLDGTPNSRGKAVRAITSLLNSHPDLFDKCTVAKSSVGIAISYGKRLAFDAMLKWTGSYWNDEVEGWYRLFWDLGVNPEFVDLGHVDTHIATTKILVLPAILYLTDEEITSLETFVRNGGLLVADSRLGTVHERLEAPAEGIPGNRLSELFGFRELDVSSGGSVVFHEERIPASSVTQLVHLLDAPNTTVLASDTEGNPAIFTHRVGKGSTLYVTSMCGLSLKQTRSRELEACLAEWLQDRHQMVANKGSFTHLSFLRGNGEEALLAINFSRQADTVTIHDFPASGPVTNLMDGTTHTIQDRSLNLVLPPLLPQVFSWRTV
jgi:beta-galactosidase